MRVTTLIIIVALVGGGLWFAKEKGYLDKAAQRAEQAADSFKAHRAKADKKYQEMSYDEALKEYHTAIEKEPAHADVPFALMRIAECHVELSKKGDPQVELKKAKEYYTRIVDEYPNHKIIPQIKKSLEKVESMGGW